MVYTWVYSENVFHLVSDGRRPVGFQRPTETAVTGAPRRIFVLVVVAVFVQIVEDVVKDQVVAVLILGLENKTGSLKVEILRASFINLEFR